MTNQQKIQVFKDQLVNDVGRFMKESKSDLIEFHPYFRIYVEKSDMDNNPIYEPVIVTYLHSDGTLGLHEHEEMDITELSIHEIAYILDALQMNNYKSTELF